MVRTEDNWTRTLILLLCFTHPLPFFSRQPRSHLLTGRPNHPLSSSLLRRLHCSPQSSASLSKFQLLPSSHRHLQSPSMPQFRLQFSFRSKSSPPPALYDASTVSLLPSPVSHPPLSRSSIFHQRCSQKRLQTAAAPSSSPAQHHRLRRTPTKPPQHDLEAFRSLLL
ncbi:hypothetical protein PIB30_029297 [Stylosanthes scabra]|uniref:Uncharacterized protein n=1 Tax=Stylosanthes scabra TaxID=79078 RepID=A0ABU6X9C2_9FABA|nr:hypothetical protein [Stylosanthes scabra]